MTSRRQALTLALVVGLAAAGGLAQAAPARGVAFEPSVRLTRPDLGGFEPSIVVDRYSNVYVTAHKQRQINAVAPDAESPSGIRTASFLWTSSDGRHFHDVTPDQSYLMHFGDEGEIALDGADHLFMVDTNVTDVTFARWRIAGKGKQVLESSTPALGTAQPLDDRPWVAANSAGDVLYTGNGAATVVNAASVSGRGNGSGAGRFTVYMSHDRGETFDLRGVTLKDSGWCYPAADPRPHSHTFYVACTDNDVDTPTQAYDHAVRLFTSVDAGTTWSRQVLGHYQTPTWPSVKVASDGTVHVMVGDTISTPRGTKGVLRLFSGRGHRFRERQLPAVGARVPFAWMAVAPNGTVGAAYYGQRSSTSPWYVQVDLLDPHGRLTTGQISDVPLAAASEVPNGDFFEDAFGPDNKLYVAFTAYNQDPTSAAGLGTDVYVAHQS